MEKLKRYNYYLGSDGFGNHVVREMEIDTGENIKLSDPVPGLSCTIGEWIGKGKEVVQHVTGMCSKNCVHLTLPSGKVIEVKE